MRLPGRRRSLHLDTTVGHDVVAAGTNSGADIVDSSIGHDFVGRGEESGADILRTTIGHDMLLLGLGGGTHLESVTIGHDFFASKPQTVQTGHNAPDTPGGPVKVGHDFTIDGSPDFPFVFDGLCDLHVATRPERSRTGRSTSASGSANNCAGNGAAGEHGRPRPRRDRQHGGRRASSARRRSTSAPTTSAAISCSATTRRPGRLAERLGQHRRAGRDLRGEQP